MLKLYMYVERNTSLFVPTHAVIGRKVNMAARLMMHYPNRVTCDNDTFHHSKLHKSNFATMEVREMKGLQNVGIIREFTETVRSVSQYKPAPLGYSMCSVRPMSVTANILQISRCWQHQ